MEFAALRELVPATPATIEAAEEALARGDADEALALARWLGSDFGRFRRDLVQASALLELGDVEAAEEQPETLPAIAETSALEAIALLESRADYAEGRGNATLVLPRALFQLGRHDESERAVRQAEAIFSSVSAQSCVAATLVTRDDIRRGAGNVDEAADLYRKAAERPPGLPLLGERRHAHSRTRPRSSPSGITLPRSGRCWCPRSASRTGTEPSSRGSAGAH